MKPETVANEVGRLVKRLVRANKLPAEWKASDLVSLIGEYRGLIGAIDSDAVHRKPAQTIDEIMQHGRKGAYEEVERKARMLDPIARKAMKRGKGK